MPPCPIGLVPTLHCDGRGRRSRWGNYRTASTVTPVRPDVPGGGAGHHHPRWSSWASIGLDVDAMWCWRDSKSVLTVEDDDDTREDLLVRSRHLGHIRTSDGSGNDCTCTVLLTKDLARLYYCKYCTEYSTSIARGLRLVHAVPPIGCPGDVLDRGWRVIGSIGWSSCGVALKDWSLAYDTAVSPVQ
jgi:hypothetical protein